MSKVECLKKAAINLAISDFSRAKQPSYWYESVHYQ